MPAFLCAKKSAFLSKNGTLTKTKAIVRELLRDFLVLFAVFARQKVSINENVSFTDYTSRIQLPDRISKIGKMTITPQFADIKSSFLTFLT